jgi:hypothetical protein
MDFLFMPKNRIVKIINWLLLTYLGIHAFLFLLYHGLRIFFFEFHPDRFWVTNFVAEKLAMTVGMAVIGISRTDLPDDLFLGTVGFVIFSICQWFVKKYNAI